MARVGRIGPVQPADVGVAGPVGRLQMTAGLVHANPLDRGALDDARLRRPVQPDVEPAALAEHDRRAPAEDHALAGVAQPEDVLLAVPAEIVVLMPGRRR